MTSLAQPEKCRWSAGRVQACLMGAVVALPTLAWAWLQLGVQWPCPMRLLSGLPCAACGSIRALGSVARLDLPSALGFNPLLVMALFSLPFLPLLRRSAAVRGLPAGFWTLLILNWIYLILYLPS